MQISSAVSHLTLLGKGFVTQPLSFQSLSTFGIYIRPRVICVQVDNWEYVSSQLALTCMYKCISNHYF